jgi:hypothetical protein
MSKQSDPDPAETVKSKRDTEVTRRRTPDNQRGKGWRKAASNPISGRASGNYSVNLGQWEHTPVAALGRKMLIPVLQWSFMRNRLAPDHAGSAKTLK